MWVYQFWWLTCSSSLYLFMVFGTYKQRSITKSDLLLLFFWAVCKWIRRVYEPLLWQRLICLAHIRGMITGIIRVVYFFKADLFGDITFHGIFTMTWTLVESGVYFIAATLPSLHSLIRHISKDPRFEMMYSSLVGYCTRAFSADNHSKDSTKTRELKSAGRNGAAITAEDKVRSGKFVKIDERRIESSKVSKEDTELGYW